MKEIVSTAWETIKNVVQVAIMAIGEFFSTALTIITLPFQFIWENCKEIITTAWEAIKGVISTALEAIKTGITTAWEMVKTTTSTVFEAVKTVLTTVWKLDATDEACVNATKLANAHDALMAMKDTYYQLCTGAAELT